MFHLQFLASTCIGLCLSAPIPNVIDDQADARAIVDRAFPE